MSPWLTSTTARTTTSAPWVLKPPHSKQPKLTGKSHKSCKNPVEYVSVRIKRKAESSHNRIDFSF